MNRKDFLQRSLRGALLIGVGQGLSSFRLPENWPSPDDIALRFAVVSDGHYGQRETEYDFRHRNMVKWLNDEYQARSLDFSMINGDLFHNRAEYLPQAKDVWDNLQMPYYISHGNHDLVSETQWKETWNRPFNYSFEIGETAFIVLNTATDQGHYICPDIAWTQTELNRLSGKPHLFVFMHITPFKWTSGGISCPDITDMFTRQANLRAIFHGHDHDQDDVKQQGGKPYFFDSHVAGDWGTDYYGYRIVEVLKNGQILTYQMNAARNQRINHDKLNVRSGT